jgi:hypothetical protein
MTSRLSFAMMLTMGVYGLRAEPPGPVPSTFPDLPVAVAQELQSRGCKVPNKKSKSFIHGEFLKSGQSDWAVLCSTKKSTSLLVFSSGSREGVAVLETMLRGFSKWSISVISQERLNSAKSAWAGSGVALTEIDHQGISSFVEFGEPGGCLYCYSAQGSTHYYHQGHWLILLATTVN